jgi:TPP-dependent pyruvate/acetoin dehydrogenase alpha subunit
VTSTRLTNKKATAKVQKGDLLRLYYKMQLIRVMEEHIVSASNTGLIPGSTHVCIGQEAISVGACEALHHDDLVLATYRGHGTFLAKGGEPKELMSEVMLREPGCCRGKGGSMHLCDLDHGLLMTSAIVASQIPIAAGVALSCKLRNTGQVVAVFFGDGAACEGAFFETINLAQLWQVPLLFICENNGYALATPVSMSHATPDIVDRATGVGMRSQIVDGNDVLAVLDAIAAAAEVARSGHGPTLIECKTVRYGMHSTRSPGVYDDPDDQHAWKKVDPIPHFRNRLLSSELVQESELDALDDEAKRTARVAREFAESAPYPSDELIKSHVFANE